MICFQNSDRTYTIIFDKGSVGKHWKAKNVRYSEVFVVHATLQLMLSDCPLIERH